MPTSSNKQPKKGEDGMGKAGKRIEMVEDRCVQEMYVEGRCVKDFRVKVLLVREVCVKAWCVEVVCGEDSCVKVLWVKERYGTGADVKALRVQVLRGQECLKELREKEWCGTEVCVKVWCNVLCVKCCMYKSCGG